MKTVYTELFLLDNILINYYFLYISGAVLHKKINRCGGLTAAAVGAVYGLFQLSGCSLLSSLPLKLLLSIFMVYVSYRPDKNAFARLLLCFYGFSFIFAGGIFAFFYTTTKDSFLRSVFFLPIPLRFAMIIILFGHFLKKQLLNIIAMLTYCKQGITLYISCLKNPLTVSCYSDTGNQCSYFGKPVAFVNKNYLNLDEETKNIIAGNISDNPPHINIVYIPFKTAGSTVSTVPGFKCERAVLTCGSKVKELCLYIALTDHDFCGEPCLINPALLD